MKKIYQVELVDLKNNDIVNSWHYDYYTNKKEAFKEARKVSKDFHFDCTHILVNEYSVIKIEDDEKQLEYEGCLLTVKKKG